MSRGESLSVWMDGKLVAMLSRHRDRLSLTYSEDARAAYDVNVPLISVSLPLLPQTYKHDRVRAFFDGLLPEGEARRMLAYDFRVAEDDTFNLLRALGRDCAGALVILPEGEPLPAPTASNPVPLTDEQVAIRLRNLATEPLGVDQQVRISLAGVQYKLVLSKLPTGEWALPIDGLPSTHILKRANPRFEHMVENEAFCLAIARHLGLRVADATLANNPDPTLIVTRYDRMVVGDGQIRRIHQEDLAQALSLNASAKYEEKGGPSLKRVARLLRDVARGSETLVELLDITFLNMVVGNADAHAKNLSLLHVEPGVVELAPAYDIMSTGYYPIASVVPGMYVNGKQSIEQVSAQDVIAEAISWGLSSDRVTARVEQLLARLPAAIEVAARDVPNLPRDLLAYVSERARTYLEGSR